MFLRVALPVPLDRLFDYLPLTGDEQVGARVQVQFGPRTLIGLIAELSDTSELPTSKLRPIKALLDKTPLVSKELMELGYWAATYYQYPIGDALLHLVPNLARKETELLSKPVRAYRLTAEASIDNVSKRAIRQRALFLHIQQTPAGVEEQELRASGYEKRVIDALMESRQIESFTPVAEQLTPEIKLAQPPLQLSSEQQTAVEQINQAEGYQCFLLAGVTGSGKTEVYLQAIEPQLNKGRQVLLLVPEIGLTPQLVKRFSSRFEAPLVTLHSGMSDRARYDAWSQARSGAARIIIGTRSSIFVPLKNPGLILIDEEHDTSLKQQDGFRYNARDLALVRAQKLGVPVILGSATPALESLLNSQNRRYQQLLLTERAGGARPTQFELIDMRTQSEDAGVTSEAIRQTAMHLKAGNQVLIFINRRGFSPSLVCQSCGEAVHCTRCDAHMTLHRKPARLHCHHCDRQTPIPRFCDQCNSSELRPSGSGTERIEARLTELFPEHPVRRVDRDSTHSRQAFDQLMSDVNSGTPQILVGTQMLAKGHHFPNVTLVVILNVDAGLLSADFRAMERTAQLLLQVSGRAGRAEKPGRVLIQTLHPQHPVLCTLISQGYLEYARQELNSRKKLNLPPFSYQAIVRAEATRPGWAEAYLMRLRQHMENAGATEAGLLFAGPLPASMEKRAGMYRALLVLTSNSRSRLQHLLQQGRHWIEQDAEAPRVRLSIDVDPVDAS